MATASGDVPASFYRFLDVTAGDYLRAVVRYERRSWAEVYRREDVGDETVAERAVTRKCRRGPVDADADDPRCTVQVFDEAVLLDFPLSRRRGVLVSLDPNAARDLGSFVERCESRLTKAGET